MHPFSIPWKQKILSFLCLGGERKGALGPTRLSLNYLQLRAGLCNKRPPKLYRNKIEKESESWN